MKLISNLINISVLFLPLVFSAFSVVKKSALFGIISILLLFIIVLLVPLCKGNENIWMFFLSNITLLPINVMIIKSIISYINVGSGIFSKIVTAILVYFVISQIQEIILGVAVRILKPNQIRFNINR